MKANRWSYVEVVSNGKPEGVGPTTPSVFQTHQDLGPPLVCAIANQEVNGQRFVVRVNEETSGESLCFPGEDCRPVWQSSYVGGLGSSSSAKGADVSGEASKSGRVNISNLSKIPAIRISTGGEGACRNISTEKCSLEARRNDDTVVNSLRVDVAEEDEVGSLRVSPSLLPRELDGSLAGLGRGPGCRLSDEDVGPSLAPGLLSSGPERIRSSDVDVKSSAGSPIPSGLRVSCRIESGSANTERARHLKSRLKKLGCVLSTMKLGVGAQQLSCGGLQKPRKKKKIGCTSSRDAILSFERKRRVGSNRVRAAGA
ncbi:hypothetical protein Ancab_021234 [Ancistrocladus abbreviatus]